MKKKYFLLLNCLIVLVLAATVFAVGLYGPAQRRFLSGEQRIFRVDLPQQALEIWRTNGIKGRILFHFARRNNARDDLAGITAENYLYHAMHENRIRVLFHVIPDGSWPEVAAALEKRSQVSREGKGFRLVIEGMPVHVIRMGDVKSPGERVLVNIEAKWWEVHEFAAIEDLLRRGILSADMVTISKLPGEAG